MNSRILVVAIVFLSILSFGYWSLTAETWSDIAVAKQGYLQQKRLLARLQQLPKREEQIRAALQELNTGFVEASLYAGDNSAVRTQIQRDIRQVAASAGLNIGNMRPLLARELDDELIFTPIQLTFSATHDDNLAFLTALESVEPILRVNRMSVSVQTPSEVDRPATLSVTMEVGGYRLEGG
ncbi:MAG: type 4a pilus biogenesis protein PilO [Kordiimonadaceae bacterium]|nr:type 4a pilus biogenesis protein PilO [Kordiimonadaceae bacterium]MBO6568584.1 type 4a pilus biogenesis protein PilO [Kordiimonadaceae bacterium]MBO6965461.1 type 4a pilus biogenesis protein PilO [Kordiimonadaceae bacterium]